MMTTQETQATQTPDPNLFVPQVRFKVEGEVLLGRIMKQGEENFLLRTTSAIYTVPKDQVERLDG